MKLMSLTITVVIEDDLYDGLSEDQIGELDEAVSSDIRRVEQLAKELIDQREDVYLMPVWH